MTTAPVHPVPPTPKLLAEAGASLRRGGLVVMPTETVYGLAVNALDAASVARVFETKARPSFDPLIVHVADPSDAIALVESWPVAAQKLAEAFWPGPLTMVLPKADTVPDLVTSGLPSVGVRCPAHPVARDLIRVAERPLAAPSANRFGSISPTRAQDAATELAAHLQPSDMILDGGPCTTGVESTVIGLVETPTLLRPGGVPAEAIEAVLGQPLAAPQTVTESSVHAQKGMASPGMLERHYAPRTPLTLMPQGALQTTTLPQGAAVLRLPADPIQAAAALFTELRCLDNDPTVTAIFAERVDDQGLGRAINDRLTRAATPSAAS